MSSTYIPIGMNPKLILTMLAEKPLWTVSGEHIATKVSENPDNYPGQYRQSQKKTFDLLFCFYVLVLLSC